MEGGALSYAGADPAGRVWFPTSICSSLRAIVGIRDPGTMLGVRGAAIGRCDLPVIRLRPRAFGRLVRKGLPEDMQLYTALGV